MESCFKVCTNVVNVIVLILFISCPIITQQVVGRTSLLVELSKREDLMKMAGYGEEKLSTVLMSGTVLCQAASSKEAQLSTKYVAGAVVGVSCHHPRRKQRKLSNWAQVTTDLYGDFVIDLPSHLYATPNLENKCVVKVVSLPKSSTCWPFFTGKQATGLKLYLEKDGLRIFTAGIYLTQNFSQEKESKANI